MRTASTTIIFTLMCWAIQAQHLMINQEAGKFYIVHEVLAKQNWYTIGRMYNVSPKEIAPFNGTSIEKLLSIGQELKIPLIENNFVQSGQPAENEVFVPLFHTVKEKEGLFRVSSLYNKVDQKSLKAWNNLKNAELPKGKDIVVGYLRVRKNVSPLASEGLTVIPEQVTGKSEQAIAKTDQAKTKTEQLNAKAEQENPKVDQAITKTDPSSGKANNNKPNNGKVDSLKVKSDAAISKTEKYTGQSIPFTPLNASDLPASPGTEGIFASTFDEQTRNGRSNVVSGNASVFRSTSGWKDGKYYVLMNDVSPGTIVKVQSSVNGRVVYAKVLSELPAIKENEGLLLRISNAAAAQLMMNETKFGISVHY